MFGSEKIRAFILCNESMGILEQILETNKSLSKQVASLSDIVSSMKKKIDEIQHKDRLVLKFSDDETLNTSMTARVLGLKQHELDDLIEEGLLQSRGERKRIFLAKDILNYLNQKDIMPDKEKILEPPKAKKGKKIRIPIQDVVETGEWTKLVRMNG